MAVAIRELAAPLAAREWLQKFWEARGRLPYRWEIPPALLEWFPGRRVPVGWQAELELIAALRQLGLEPTWTPGADAAGVDVKFTLAGVRVRVQLKVRREAGAVQYRILRRTARTADLLLVLPAAAVGRLTDLVPRLVEALTVKLGWA